MQTADTLIIGGGFVGSLCAISLHQYGISSFLIDAKDIRYPDLSDGRTIAITHGSKCIFETLGFWNALEPYACPIHVMRVFEAETPFFVNYNTQELDLPPIGYIIEYPHLARVLAQELCKIPGLVKGTVTSLQRSSYQAAVTLEDGSIFQAPLCISAEGSRGKTYLNTRIQKTTFDYDHEALVVHTTHDEPHHDHAWEVFTEKGFLAVLPMTTCPSTGGFRSGLVMSHPRGIPKLSHEALEEKITELFPFYGKMSIISKRWTYRLYGMKTNTLFDTRYVAIGDAAHVIHPIAGLGVNMGWRDAFELSKKIRDAKTLGLDPGSLSFLSDFERHRIGDHKGHLWATHGLLRLFHNPYLSSLRRFGLACTERMPKLKRMILKKAMRYVVS